MRPQVKQLIDLMEKEGWTRADGRLTDSSCLGITYYHPPHVSHPRICAYGVQIDPTTYMSFEDDERRYMSDLIDRRYKAYKAAERQKGESKLAAFLSARRS